MGGRHICATAACAVMVLAAWSSVARASFLEYAKLTAPTTGPSAEVGGGEFGSSAAVSSDGTTAIIGAFEDHSAAGAAYVYTRSGTSWALQAKLTAPTSGATRAIGASEFGGHVALSDDGNTALIGGFADNSDAGAAWVYVRTGATWSVQQKLVAPTTGGDREVAPGQFGSRVSLNAGGTVALIAGVQDNAFAGAAWTFTRTGSAWSEQHKLIAPATGADAEIGEGDFGSATWLAPDGQTAVIGGDGDHGSVGAAWVFTASGTSWTEQAKLIPPTSGPDAGTGTPTFGSAVSLTDDANTALIGAQSDNQRGAAWVFTRAGTTWSERQKLTAPTSGPGAELGQGFFGVSGVLSADGATAVVGALLDNSGVGAAYTYARAGTGVGWALQNKLTAPVGTDAEVGSGVFAGTLALSHDAATLLIGGLSDNNLTGAVWSYAATAPPAVSGVAPASGPSRGGTAVVIQGSGFAATGLDAVTTVTFSGVPANSFHVVSPAEIDAVAPPHAAGVTDVIVNAPAGSSATTSADTFTYVAPPRSPTKVKAIAGNGRVKVAFTVTPAVGPVTYRVNASPGGGHASAPRSPITVRGLRNGKRYRFRVVATNAAGASPASAPSRPVTPFAPAKASRVSIRGVGRDAPALAFTLTAGRHSPELVSVAVTLSGGLRFAAHQLAGHVRVGARRVRGSVRVSRGALLITLRRSAPRIVVRIVSPAVTARPSLARNVRRRRVGRQVLIRLRVGDAARNATSLRLRLRLS